MQGLWGSLLPLGLFFGCYKLFGLYLATAVLLLITLLVTAMGYWRSRRIDVWQITSSGFVVLMAAATLVFRNPWFIKLKPTAVYWLLAISFVVCKLWRKNCPTMVELMLKHLPYSVGQKTTNYLNYLWGISFGLIGLVNLAVAYNCSTDVWVNFKLFGALGWLLITSVLQGVIMHLVDDESCKS